MASRRAIQTLTLRSSYSLLRSQCTAPRRATPSIVAARNGFARPSVATAAGQQQRWHSGFPSDKRSKMYEFEDIKQLIENPNENTLLVDVREPSEFDANSIPTALNIPIASQPDSLLLPAEEFEDRYGFAKPPLDKEIVFFCKAGVRSSAAAQIAKQGGYLNVGEYRGSWLDWEKRGGVGTRTGPPE
ncbi:Rhodanese-like protein [Aaosphaeria arxii CBS 175.79]|uniref:Rhodanese-like protein n=1 Tax=Aaosphaeria arxii CBS 175.79 TaxID=1450172 RepID=A0A6A5XBM0_9PLEO|nr:Rhodanese-like protein [Aaosphaeria arxii CBS 175.79]KAF2010331.1 Rhodanese-like protein [Aaosphaeria arxii CBS 175.79]